MVLVLAPKKITALVSSELLAQLNNQISKTKKPPAPHSCARSTSCVRSTHCASEQAMSVFSQRKFNSSVCFVLKSKGGGKPTIHRDRLPVPAVWISTLFQENTSWKVCHVCAPAFSSRTTPSSHRSRTASWSGRAPSLPHRDV